MLIHTPRLCAERLFLEGRTDTVAPAAPIECQPVVRQLPKEIAGEEEEATLSAVQKAETTTEEEGAVRTEVDTPEEPLVASGEEQAKSEQLDEHLNEDDDQEQYFDEESYEEEQETMLTLVYDPETGEIESAVTDSGENVFLDSALRRMLFGEDDDAEVAAADSGSAQPQNGEEAQVHLEADGGIADLRQIVSVRARLTNQLITDRTKRLNSHPITDSRFHLGRAADLCCSRSRSRSRSRRSGAGSGPGGSAAGSASSLASTAR